MKPKIISALAVVLFISNSLNANVINDPKSYPCHDASGNLADAVGEYLGLNHEQTHNLFLALYDNCVNG